jgi:DedD protein
MDERTKRRLVGATVLVSAFVVVAPMLLDQSGTESWKPRETALPALPAEPFPGRAPGLEPPPGLPDVSAQEPLAVPFEVPPEGAEPDGAGEPVADLAPVQATPAPGPEPAAGRPGGEAAGGPPPSPGPAPPPAGGPPAADARVGLSAWAVQLSAFANAANAISLRNALRGRGFVAFVESAPDKMTRVYVGPELKREKAVAAQQRLARDLGIKGTVVPYPGGSPP